MKILEILKRCATQRKQNSPRRLQEYSAPPDTLVIPRGGFFPEAETGVSILAKELATWIQEQGFDTEIAILLPAGTGSTAFYLSKAFSEISGRLPKVTVFTVPVAVTRRVLESDLEKLGTSFLLPLPNDSRKTTAIPCHHRLQKKVPFCEPVQRILVDL